MCTAPSFRAPGQPGFALTEIANWENVPATSLSNLDAESSSTHIVRMFSSNQLPTLRVSGSLPVSRRVTPALAGERIFFLRRNNTHCCFFVTSLKPFHLYSCIRINQMPYSSCFTTVSL